jgi:hypothetical protein
MRISPTEREKIYRQAKHRLGEPIRKVQLEDEALDSLLEIATEDYVEYIQNYLIEQQWPSLIGINVTEADLTRAFINRNYDLLTQYTYSYSKIVGLGAGEGGYILKKDYISLINGVQIYEIPANREINEVLWFNSPTLDQSVIDPFLGVWNNNFGGEYAGLGGGGYYMLPAFDILMRQSDRNLKNRLTRGELTYKITGAPNGKKYLHIFNVPGGKYDQGLGELNYGKVWYWYYDINSGNKDDCLAKNKDIIKTPSDVPLDDVSFDDLNDPSKVWIRRYFIALCKETLGRIRGYANGKVPISENASIDLDYQSLFTEGKDEMMVLKQELNDRLAKLHPTETLKRMATEAEEINKALKFRPMPKPIKMI